MTLMSLRAALGTVMLAGCTGGLTGCGINPESALPISPETGTAVGGPLSGKALGGQQPVSGRHVYVFSTGVGGYGTGSTSLLTTSSGTTASPAVSDGTNYYLTTDSNGVFSLSAAPGCSAGTQTYIYIVGGNPGNSNGQTNSAIGEMTPLGPSGRAASTLPAPCPAS